MISCKVCGRLFMGDKEDEKLIDIDNWLCSPCKLYLSKNK